MKKGICRVSIIIFTLLFISCFKKKEFNYSGSYKTAYLNAIGLKLDMPAPYQGQVGDTVRFKVTGIDTLSKINSSSIEFYLNGMRSVIKSINMVDSSITVIVPDNASTGAASMVIGDRQFYGPNFNILGWAWVDSTFNATTSKDEKGNTILGKATNGTIWDLYYDAYSSNQNLFATGSFSMWNGLSYYGTTPDAFHNNNTSGIVQLNPSNGVIRDNFYTGEGPNSGATIFGITKLTSFPGYLIYGSGFSRFGIYSGVNNMTRIYQSGLIDSVITNVYNPDPNNAAANIGAFVNFRAGFDGAVKKVFIDASGRLINIGNFYRYAINDYSLSTATSIVKNYTYQNQIAATDQDGNLDTTYNYDPYRTKNFGTNGSINDAVQLSNGSIIIGGSFTVFNSENSGRIVMLDNNGKRNPAFDIGTGADGTITKITYNAATQKILVVGDFKTFNGVPCPAGLIMLNTNGTVSSGFNLGDFQRSTANNGRLINYAGQLSDGKIIISGSFEKYMDAASGQYVTRQGFMILNADGTLAANLNNTGAFSGTINDIFETQTPSGRKAVIIAGSISLFDNNTVYNILRIGIQRK